jgi:hypothetical protein
MSDSLSSFAAIFRAVLLLHGDETPVTKREIVQKTVSTLGINKTPFEAIFALREKDAPKLSETKAHEIFGDYLSQIEQVIEFVDKLER